MNNYHMLIVNTTAMLGLVARVCDRIDWFLSPEERQVLSLHCSAGGLVREVLEVAEDLDAELFQEHDNDMVSTIAATLARRVVDRETTYIHLPTPHFSPKNWSSTIAEKEETI